MLGDTVVLLAAFTLAYILRVQYDPRPLRADVYAYEYLFDFLLIVPFWIIIFAALGLYHSSVFNRRLLEWSKIAIGSFIGILIVIGWEYVTDETILPARLVVVYALIAAFILIVLEREILKFIRGQLFKYGRGVSRVLLIGTSSATSDIAISLNNTAKSGYDVVAVAGPKKYMLDTINAEHYSQVEAALKNIEADNVTTIIQTDLYDSPARNQRILSAAQENHLSYSFIPGEAEFYSGKNTVDVFLGYPMITVYQTPLIGWGAIVKRIFDMAVVLVLLPIWLPVFLILVLLQKLLNPGKAVFVNGRLGRYGQKFSLYKFRSMKEEFSGQDNAAADIFRKMDREDLAQEYERNHKVENDPRITKFGKFLRATSLDEMPQIFNVIKGDMSLIGPRPILPFERKYYKNRGSLLFSVKPGITGLWQVSGRSDMPFEQRVDLELYYAQNWSFWMDIKILFKTAAAVFLARGAR